MASVSGQIDDNNAYNPNCNKKCPNECPLQWKSDDQTVNALVETITSVECGKY